MFKKRKRKPLNDSSLIRVKTTPQMLDYDRFAARGRSQYLPYVMGFNAAEFTSNAINTDHLGFRYSVDSDGNPISVGTLNKEKYPHVNLLVGASPSLGYGATSDATTVASRLTAHDPSGTPWLNFAGHCYNSAQELVLYIMHAHRLPKIKNIVIMSGFNTLVMARLPEFIRGELPPFYFCGEHYEKFDDIARENGAEVQDKKLPKWPAETTAVPPIEQTIHIGATESLRCLQQWAHLARGVDAKLTYLMQPLATWVRKPCAEEQLLYDELDQLSRLGTWDTLYGDISAPSVAGSYADMLATGCHQLNIPFGNLVIELQQCAEDEWLFVDRAHFTDHGNDTVAKSIHKLLW